MRVEIHIGWSGRFGGYGPRGELRWLGFKGTLEVVTDGRGLVAGEGIGADDGNLGWGEGHHRL